MVTDKTVAKKQVETKDYDNGMKRKNIILWAVIFSGSLLYFMRKGREVRNGNFRSKQFKENIHHKIWR